MTFPTKIEYAVALLLGDSSVEEVHSCFEPELDLLRETNTNLKDKRRSSDLVSNRFLSPWGKTQLWWHPFQHPDPSFRQILHIFFAHFKARCKFFEQSLTRLLIEPGFFQATIYLTFITPIFTNQLNSTSIRIVLSCEMYITVAHDDLMTIRISS
jgi:hypothetical protein